MRRFILTPRHDKCGSLVTTLKIFRLLLAEEAFIQFQCSQFGLVAEKEAVEQVFLRGEVCVFLLLVMPPVLRTLLWIRGCKRESGTIEEEEEGLSSCDFYVFITVHFCI